MLPIWNKLTKASAAIATATTTSSSVKPRSSRPTRTARARAARSKGLARIGNAHASAQPIDTDREGARSLTQRDPAPGGAAVGIEADAAFCGGDPLTRQGQ